MYVKLFLFLLDPEGCNCNKVLLICNSIPAAPAYGVYISQLHIAEHVVPIMISLIEGPLLLTRNLLNQGFLVVKLK